MMTLREYEALQQIVHAREIRMHTITLNTIKWLQACPVYPNEMTCAEISKKCGIIRKEIQLIDAPLCEDLRNNRNYICWDSQQHKDDFIKNCLCSFNVTYADRV